MTRGDLPAPALPATPGRQVRWAQLASRYAMLGFFAALLVLLIVVSPTFRNPANLLNILQQNVTQYESAFGEIKLEPHAEGGIVQ